MLFPRFKLLARTPLNRRAISRSTPVLGDFPRVSILTEISNETGSLHNMLRYFWKYDLSLTHIESRPCPKGSDSFHVYIDFEGRGGDENTEKCLNDLKRLNICKNMFVLGEKQVPWFPRHISELDIVANRTLDAGIELQSDHPGFSDPVYRTRRQELASIAQNFKAGEPIPYIQYTEDEIATWGAVYTHLGKIQSQYACKEYQSILPLMERHCGYSANNIPQASDISRFLSRRTGFQLRPVAGLLSSRDFLNGLAFRVFFSTQYIRHSSRPLYTPEPDICHELLGHAPMFADPDFADFSQEIGLASLGATDEEIKQLATCYWFSVEFGLVKEKGQVKAYGAGLLSSFGELEYSCTPSTAPTTKSTSTECCFPPNVTHPNLLPWDPKVACNLAYPITTYQPTYFVAESLSDAKTKMREFSQTLPRPFHAKYNPLTSSIWVDRAVNPVSSDPYINNNLKYGM